MTDANPRPFAAHTDVAGRVAELAARTDRPDLADRLRTAIARTTRPATIVCVVGEFKQGKSSLINALLGSHVCPVDDDLATSVITLIRHGAASTLDVRRRVDGVVVTERVATVELASWATERGNPDNSLDLERVEVSLPSPLLANGLCLVDTPGMGSLGAGHAAATLAFLPFADGLIFASDASAELSAPEVEFLQQARELCPSVILALTKTDVSPHWREIRDRNVGHLQRLGCDVPIVETSAAVRWAAIGRRDPELDVASGYPLLMNRLQADVIRPAKSAAAERCRDEIAGTLEQLRAATAGELSVVDDPEQLAATLAEANQASARLEHLRGPGARWNVVVGDRITDLSNDVAFGFRGDMRRIQRSLDDSIEEMKKPAEWDDLARTLQTDVANAVTKAFIRIDTGGESIKDEVVQLIADEQLQFPTLATRERTPIDVMSLWSAKPLEPAKGKAGAAFHSGITGLRGAQSGIVMFGMMGRYLPIGVGAVVASNPVTLGMGAVFGSMQLADAHKRKIAQRRQQARANVRQFIDDVQFEIGNLITESLRTIQRALRDEFTARITELQRTYTQVAQVAQASAATNAAARQARGAALRILLTDIDALEAQSRALEAQPQ